jgi:uncharacterized protein (TIGR00369 family)
VSEPKLSPEAAALLEERGLGPLAERMGIQLTELSAERSVATMPVLGNTQPLGVLHGGAHVVLGESLGSFAANVWAHPDRVAMGIEVSASHTRACSEGMVTGVCSAISLGKNLTVHEVVISDSEGRRLSTVRITNYLKKKD